MHGQHIVKYFLDAVEGPSQVTDAPGLAFFYQKVQHTVVDIPLLKILHAASDGVQQIIVDVVGLKVDE